MRRSEQVTKCSRGVCSCRAVEDDIPLQNEFVSVQGIRHCKLIGVVVVVLNTWGDQKRASCGRDIRVKWPGGGSIRTIWPRLVYPRWLFMPKFKVSDLLHVSERSHLVVSIASSVVRLLVASP